MPFSRFERTSHIITIAALLAVCGCDKKPPSEFHLERGYALIDSNPEAALEELKKVGKPDDIEVMLGMGLAHEGLGHYPSAQEWLERARKKSPEPPVLVPLARVEIMLGNLGAARTLIQDSSKKKQDELLIHLLETCVASDAASATRALAHLDDWSKKRSDPNSRDSVEFHLARASLLGQLNRPLERRRAVEAARVSPVPDVESALSLALLASRAGRSDFATDLLERVFPEVRTPARWRHIAELAHRLGQHDLTRKCLELLPDSPDLLVLRARHELATGSKNADDAARAALPLATDDETRLELRTGLTESLLRLGKLDEARREANALLEAGEPGATKARIISARILLAEGNPTAALESIQPLALTGRKEAREVAALALIDLERDAEAVPLIEANLSENAADYFAVRLLLKVQGKLKKVDEASRTLAGLVAKRPEDVTLRILWLESMATSKDQERTLRALEDSVAAIPNDARLWMLLVQHHQTRNDRTGALATLEEAAKKNPGDPLIAAALANYLTVAGRYQEAASKYEIALQFAQDDIVALNNLAMIYADKLDDPKRAVELAERAAQKARHQPAIVDTLGWALYRRGEKGDLERAKKLLTSIEGKLESSTAKFHLGAVLIASGQRDEGRALLGRALAGGASFPESEEAKKLLAAAP